MVPLQRIPVVPLSLPLWVVFRYFMARCSCRMVRATVVWFLCSLVHVPRFCSLGLCFRSVLAVPFVVFWSFCVILSFRPFWPHSPRPPLRCPPHPRSCSHVFAPRLVCLPFQCGSPIRPLCRLPCGVFVPTPFCRDSCHRFCAGKFRPSFSRSSGFTLVRPQPCACLA